MTQNQGARANKTGNQLSLLITTNLQSVGYKFIAKNRFLACRELNQPIFTKEFNVSQTIYDTKLNCDFIIYHPTKHKECLVIEAKWQEVGGSTDEKYPYLIFNIKQKSPFKTILVLDGKGYKSGAKSWLKKQVDAKLTHVIDFADFTKLINQGFF